MCQLGFSSEIEVPQLGSARILHSSGSLEPEKSSSNSSIINYIVYVLHDVKHGLDMTFAILQILWWKMKYGIKSYKPSDKYRLISIFKNKFLYNIRNYITYILWKTWRQAWPWFKNNCYFANAQIHKWKCSTLVHYT